MIVAPDFLDHWKTRLLVRLLGTETAPLHVIRLWGHCHTRRSDRFTGWSPNVLASVCRWEGDPDLFWSAMAQTFIDVEGALLVVHDWADNNAALMTAWANGERRRNASAATPPTKPPTSAPPSGAPSGAPSAAPSGAPSAAIAQGGARGEERRGVDESGEELQLGVVQQPRPAELEAEAKAKRNSAARLILRALNEASGRHYRETPTNLDVIRCRLEEPGVTVEGCLAMVARQVARWKPDPKMSEYLRPETLFNRTKFDSYYANRDLPAEPAGPAAPGVHRGTDPNLHVAGAADRFRERRERWATEDSSAPPPGFGREPGVEG